MNQTSTSGLIFYLLTIIIATVDDWSLGPFDEQNSVMFGSWHF